VKLEKLEYRETNIVRYFKPLFVMILQLMKTPNSKLEYYEKVFKNCNQNYNK